MIEVFLDYGTFGLLAYMIYYMTVKLDRTIQNNTKTMALFNERVKKCDLKG